MLDYIEHRNRHEQYFKMKGAKMATARKTASGSYRCLAYIGKDENGKRIYKSFTAKTKKEAERKAAEYEKTEKNESTDPTLEAIITEYIENRKNIWSVNTVREYYRTLEKDISELAKLKISEINSEVLQKYVNRNSHLTEKTLKNRMTVITSPLKAYSNERINIVYPQKKKKEIIIPETEQVREILNYVEGTVLELPVMLAAMCGLRRSEICAMPKIVNGYLVIKETRALNKEREWVTQSRTKSESSTRKIKCPDIILKKIEEAGTPYIKCTPGHITKEFHRICKMLGYDFHFHALRHYCASLLMSKGFPDKYIIEYMGHHSDDMVKKVYYHTMKNKREEVENSIYATLNATFSI